MIPAFSTRRSSRAGRADLLTGSELGAGFASSLGGLGQPGLVLLGQESVAPNVAQVQPDQVLVGQLRTLVGHQPSFLEARTDRGGSHSRRSARMAVFADGSGHVADDPRHL